MKIFETPFNGNTERTDRGGLKKANKGVNLAGVTYIEDAKTGSRSFHLQKRQGDVMELIPDKSAHFGCSYNLRQGFKHCIEFGYFDNCSFRGEMVSFNLGEYCEMVNCSFNCNEVWIRSRTKPREWIFDIDNLVCLDVTNANLRELDFDTSLSEKAQNLKTVVLSQNPFSSLPAWIFHLPNLETLYLNSTNIYLYEYIFAEIKSLKTMYISQENEKTGFSVERLEKLKRNITIFRPTKGASGFVEWDRVLFIGHGGE